MQPKRKEMRQFGRPFQNENAPSVGATTEFEQDELCGAERRVARVGETTTFGDRATLERRGEQDGHHRLFDAAVDEKCRGADGRFAYLI